MRVVIAGGHGKVGRRLIWLLVERGDEVVSFDRKPDYAGEIREWGAEPVSCDLEWASVREIADALGKPDAVVFSSGAGPGSGPERKWTMDYAGVVKLIAACHLNDVRRFVLVSSRGADPEAGGEGTFAVYLRAKGRADAELQRSGLDHTIVRPTGLTDEPGTGLVALGDELDRGEISRDDVAAVLAAALGEPATIGKAFGATSGEVPIAAAVAAI
jgi:nucleoside-diphosphate-sugar epimerase